MSELYRNKMKQNYLLLVDYHSNVPEICLLKDTHSSTVITHMKSVETETGCDHDSPATMSVPQDEILAIPAPQQRAEKHYITRSGRISKPPQKHTP